MTIEIRHCTAQELKTLMDVQPGILVLDVREDWEYQTCHLQNSVHIPMQQIPAEIDSLDKSAPVVVLCHHGMRSMQVANFLAHSGFTDITNLTGGIDAWARQVDGDMPTY